MAFFKEDLDSFVNGISGPEKLYEGVKNFFSANSNIQMTL
jgi:hypothetical protein